MSRVLIIDDEPSLLSLLEQKFQRAGFEVATASDSEKGFLAATESGPELIILDLKLSEAADMSLAERLRTDSRTADIPVILLSARAGQEGDEEELEGLMTQLRKPFRPSQLLALAREHI
ncbi:MAG TPA: response regulator [Trueperaceae bacterium]